jgi:glycosyltransferase involved in cell wall biosynthesis
MIQNHGVAASKIAIFPNTIDPFFQYPTLFQKPAYLLERYGVEPNEQILFTLTRLSSTEKYKGYDLVIAALPSILKQYPNTRYFLAGKPDAAEEARILGLIEANGVKGKVVLLGYIKEEEISDHYLLADAFIMPSRKEGFGIVFIEAMACGLPVIAGNQDGSVDALQNGELGCLINPQNQQEIIDSVVAVFDKKNQATGEERLLLQQKVQKIFGFPTYKNRLRQLFQ